MKKPVIYLNAGHGGIHPITKAYMTNPADGKFYHFTEAGKVVFSAYEGETNREFARAFHTAMKDTGIDIVPVYHAFLDTPNSERIRIANSHFWQNKVQKALWLSFHSNAVGVVSKGESQAPQGYSIWTTDGVTPSDKIADIITGEVKKIAPNFGIKILEDRSDYDCDFEANFYELYYTNMPAVLMENLFFTNIKDAKLLKNTAYQKAYAQAVKTAVLQWFNPLT